MAVVTMSVFHVFCMEKGIKDKETKRAIKETAYGLMSDETYCSFLNINPFNMTADNYRRLYQAAFRIHNKLPVYELGI